MTIISFAVMAGLLLISALVSASEVAFFSLRSDDLQQCKDSSSPVDKLIVDLLRKPRVLLATILIINNLVNVGIVTLSTFVMWEMAGTRKPEEIIVGIVTFAVTIAITFFGEIIPKVFATKKNLFFSRFMAKTWKLLFLIF
jgi:Mg2+/Co2+ transporter CorB